MGADCNVEAQIEEPVPPDSTLDDHMAAAGHLSEMCLEVSI